MTIFGLMRHGIAENGGPNRSDAERRLTKAGKEQLQGQIDWLKSQNNGFARVVHSPLVRTRQTAEIVGKGLGVPVTENALLQPGCTPPDLLELLSIHYDGERCLFIGHQPDMSMITLHLTHQNTNYIPGSICLIEWNGEGTGGIISVKHPQ
jgi:phosphohistidine phosphatase